MAINLHNSEQQGVESAPKAVPALPDQTAPYETPNGGRALRQRAKIDGEAAKELADLRARPDRLKAYDYFLNLIEEGLSPALAARRTGRKVMNLLCIQAPLELIHAAGFHPFKVYAGSYAAAALGSPGVSALMCPLLRSVLGLYRLDPGVFADPWILPTTCDWIVKFPEIAESVLGKPATLSNALYWLELPHLKESSRGGEAWLAEIYRLKEHLEKIAGKKIGNPSLRDSIELYNRSWAALSRLEEMRAAGRIAPVWFFLITGTFFLDTPQAWTAAVDGVLNALAAITNASITDADTTAARVFLAGSPIFFPNFKLLRLLEEAGLQVVGDDLCSSGRLFPGAVNYRDSSEYGLLSALSQRYLLGCLCPTFADNDRRLHNILAACDSGAAFQGVVFHVLKGCHPYDIESYSLEAKLKERGLRFIRLETDYTAEDQRNLLTRLEAFHETQRVSMGMGGAQTTFATPPPITPGAPIGGLMGRGVI